MFKSVVIFVAIIAYSKCGYITHNPKTCDIKDNSCQLDFINNFIKEAATKGIPNLNIPVLDPYKIENVELDLGFFKYTLVKGNVKGLNTCNIYSYRLEMEKKTIHAEIHCDVFEIESQYICKRTPLLSKFFGDIDVHGEGTGGIKFEKKRTVVEMVYETKKLDDGEVHAVIIPAKSKYTFLGADKISVASNNLYIGSQEISTVVVNIFNENWTYFSKYIYVDQIIGKVNEFIVMYANQFLGAVPAKDLFKH